MRRRSRSRGGSEAAGGAPDFRGTLQEAPGEASRDIPRGSRRKGLTEPRGSMRGSRGVSPVGRSFWDRRYGCPGGGIFPGRDLLFRRAREAPRGYVPAMTAPPGRGRRRVLALKVRVRAAPLPGASLRGAGRHSRGEGRGTGGALDSGLPGSPREKGFHVTDDIRRGSGMSSGASRRSVAVLRCGRRTLLADGSGARAF